MKIQKGTRTSLSTFEAFKHVGHVDGLVEISGQTLVDLQRVLRMMLKDFDYVCRKHGLTYTLGGGSCLGAVRHGGFIPWDDDIDVNMPRCDFEKFKRLFAEEMGESYTVQAPGITAGYELGFGRIRLKGTRLVNRDDFVVDDDNCGVYVDIFIIENAPNNLALRSLHGFVSMFLGFAYSCRRTLLHKDEFIRLANGDEKFARIISIKAAIGRLFAFKSVPSWCAAWDKWNASVHDDWSKFITVPVGRKHYFGELLPRSAYFPVSEGNFDGLRVMLPKLPSEYLCNLYGPSFMEVPPEQDRETHAVYDIDLGPFS